MVIGLRAGAVYVGHEAILKFHPEDRPFGRLRGAGIGEVVLTTALPTKHLEQLLLQLTQMSDCRDSDGELTALIDAAHIPGVELRAAADLPTHSEPEACDWTALPEPANTSALVRAMIQRDGAANLPALAARQLLDDCERLQGSTTQALTSNVPCSRILERLMARILLADDIATTTWLLTELERRPEFDAATQQQLLQMARAHCANSWIRAKLERGTTDELLQLSSLVMQLGDDIAEEFSAAAAAVAHPLSLWLSDLLGHTDAVPQADPSSQPTSRSKQ